MKHWLSKAAVEDGTDKRRESILREKAAQFIHMRWWAAIAATALTVATAGPLDLLEERSVAPLLVMIGGLIAYNAGALWALNRSSVPLRRQLLIQVIGDLFILTGLLHFSGGVENPFLFLYLIHALLAGILLDRRRAASVAVMAVLLATSLILGEYSGLFAHYNLHLLAYTPSVQPASNLTYASAVLITLTLLIGLTSYFSTMIMSELRVSRKHAIEEAQSAAREKKKFESVLKASGAGVLIFDGDMNLIWYNRRIEEWFPEADLDTGTPCPFFHEKHCDLFEDDRTSSGASPLTNPSRTEPSCRRCVSLNAFNRGKEIDVEQVFTTADGNRRYFQFVGSPIRNEDGEIERVVELVHDVTERKRMKEQVEHRERMSSLGRLASGIAHEIGNPLSSISARLRRLKEKTEESFTQETADFLSEQINRLNRLIRDISSFAQAPEPNWTTCNARTLIDDVTSLLELDEKSKNVDIQTDVPSDMPHFLASEDQLSQVFLNLGLNALEAMPDGGTLTIRARHDDEHIRFSFTDTGKGIPAEKQTDVFTPYYTSQKRDEGTGLGLSITHSLVKAHGGEIDLQSKPDEGATFTISLPYHDPSSNSTNTRTRQTNHTSIS